MGADANISWTERRERALQELCEFGMSLARKLAAKGEEAKTLEETERCAEAFDRVARSVRLTFALQARLERETRRAIAEDVTSRRAQLRDAVRAVIRPNFPMGERLERERELDDRLAFEVLAADFLDRPVDDLIARIRRDLDLVEEGDATDPPPLGEVDRASRRETEGAVTRGAAYARGDLTP